MVTYETLLEITRARLESDEIPKPPSPLRKLREFDLKELLDVVIPVLYLYTRGKKDEPIFLTEAVCAIGRAVLSHFEQPKDSGLAAKIGAFLLYSFEVGKILTVIKAQGKGKNAAYRIIINDDASIRLLWESLDSSYVEKLPSLEEFKPYETSEHPTGHKLVKTNNKTVLKRLTKQTHPIVFNAVNKAMKTGWRVNTRVFDVAMWSLRNKVVAFNDIWSQQNPEARRTKLRESRTILDIAFRFLDKTFYHLMYLDFRGRMYTASAFFNHQGNDLAKGLLLRADKASITRDGFDWLLISLANNYAGSCGRPDGRKTDKIPLQDRISWAKENENIFLAFATDPRKHQGWMKADAPWQFLAACFELKLFREWQEKNAEKIKSGAIGEYDYETSVEVFIDGSCNGSQHLSALTKDEVTAPYVNLVPQEFPGDLYQYAATFVWKEIDRQLAAISSYRDELESFVDELIALKNTYLKAPQNTVSKKEAWDNYQKFKKNKEAVIEAATPVFWSRVTDLKDRRKILKRGTMTISYGVTRYGLGTQILDDAKKHGIPLLDVMEHKWGILLGQIIFDTLNSSMERPMQLLRLFEEAGAAADMRDEFLEWTVPVTNFPVIQHYTEGTTKQIWVNYGPPKGEKQSTGYYENTLRLNVNFHEILKKSKGKQKSGASPNCIHSLDAAHLMLVIDRADFIVTTIHDSYGCLPSDMPKLFKLVRETFVELYSKNPLDHLLKELGRDISEVKIGTYSVEDILKSEFAFS